MKIVLLLLIYPSIRIQWSLCWGRTGGSHFCCLCLIYLIGIKRGAKFPSVSLCSLYNFELRFPHLQDIAESRSEDLYANLTVKKTGA